MFLSVMFHNFGIANHEISQHKTDSLNYVTFVSAKKINSLMLLLRWEYDRNDKTQNREIQLSEGDSCVILCVILRPGHATKLNFR